MHSSIDLFSIVLAVIFLVIGYTLFSSLFGSTSLNEDKPPPKNYIEIRKRREERQEKIKAEYEEKKALKLKAREEKDKIYQEKKENKKREKEEKKRIAKENKKNFFSWLKPKIKITHHKNNTIISDSSKAKDFEPPKSFFGANTNEKDEISEKMERLIKEIKDL